MLVEKILMMRLINDSYINVFDMFSVTQIMYELKQNNKSKIRKLLKQPHELTRKYISKHSLCTALCFFCLSIPQRSGAVEHLTTNQEVLG